jgi:predicted anti-sigma-YlaC factor YlaD
MDDIIHLHGDPHRITESLLPWYVSGQLEAGERASVEAHLSACAECRADLRREHRLSAEVAGLSLDAELGWERLRERVMPRPDMAPFENAVVPLRHLASNWSRTFGLFLGAQAAMLALAVVLFPPGAPEAPYQTLGAAPSERTGNLIVLFRPDTREQELRTALGTAHAQLVGGPTLAGAYVLYVAPTERAAALASLRAGSDVVLAQPIDPRVQP